VGNLNFHCIHDESLNSANPGVSQGLLEFAGMLDENTITHFETANILKETQHNPK
jgi:hypothetical protein